MSSSDAAPVRIETNADGINKSPHPELPLPDSEADVEGRTLLIPG
jgi:hypothetical protein